MTCEIFTNEILTGEQLDIVAGGTFTSNEYDERIYNQAGMRTKFNIFAKDQFFIRDKTGKVEVSITPDQADWAVRYWKKTGKQAYYEMVAKAVKE